MMIAVLSPFAPWPTNRQGPTSLLHSILRYRGTTHSVILYYHDPSDGFDENTHDCFIGPCAYRKVTKYRGLKKYVQLAAAVLSGYPYECGLHDWRSAILTLPPDTSRIIAYTFWPLLSLRRSAIPIEIIGPDCASLHERRTAKKNPIFYRRAFASVRAMQFRRLERTASRTARSVWFVGKADAVYWRLITNHTAKLLRHPLSEDVAAYYQAPK